MNSASVTAETTVNPSTQNPKQPQQKQTAKEVIVANVQALIEQLSVLSQSHDVGPAIFAGREQAFTLPGALHAGLATGVRELNRRVCALPMQEVHDPGERGDVVVLPNTEVVRGDSSFGKDGGGFRENKACTSDGAAAQMDQVPVVGETVAAGVLAHRRDSDAVGQSEIANGERREEIGHND
jgi:hypothetical protein